ncbi:glycosyltransferase family 4 protein [Motiliproteus sp. SC1-56]|uniref:glycosyltransferase family 4 protein n=1 Tax=Motiliproteus sp. SC1-56 TaxID=2799565 RepID=UPI001A8F9841|nr:glycosyltransferase family 4 protein [Motiliproteus sp. SC1-56]
MDQAKVIYQPSTRIKRNKSAVKILTITTLFPNCQDPKHGIFVESRLKHLVSQYPDIELTIIAPIPWFPFAGKHFGSYAKFAKVPRQESRIGAVVYHPRYLVIPKIGMLITPFTLAISIIICLKKQFSIDSDFDLVDGHYFYPDGVAIAICKPWLKVPLFLTARGTDLNLIPRYRLPRMLVQWASKRATKVFTVCEALRRAAIGIGFPANQVVTLRNGVDLELFHPPRSRESLRENLGIQGNAILSVGHLIERKGHHLIIDALVGLQGVTLYIAGDGPLRSQLQKQAADRGVASRVRFLGSLSQAELVTYYGAVDALVLASSREGWANVLLESMACGTPVVATCVWGTPEVVQPDSGGKLCERSAHSIATAITELFEHPPERTNVRSYAERFDWAQTSFGQRTHFEEAIRVA